MSQSKFKATNLLAGTALVALGVAFAGQVSAKDHARVIKSGKDQTSLSISGHVSRQITIVDDGRTSVRHSDSNFSSSRIVLKAAGKINADMKVATKIETAVDDARNAPATEGTEFDARSGNDLQTRKAEIQLSHKSFGTVWIGAGDTAGNGITEHSFVGFSMLPGAIFLQSGGAFRAVSPEGDNNGTAVARVANVMSQPDMMGRSTRIRYDTPVIAGFMASTSHLDNQDFDVALRYNGKFFGTKIKAGAAYANNASGAASTTATQNSTGQELYGGSIAFSHSSGLGASYGIEYVNDESRTGELLTDNNKDPLFQNAQLFYTSKFSEMGATTFVYEYNQHENKRNSADIGRAHSIGIAQNIDAAAMDIALRFSTVELDNDTITLANDDVNALSIHTRVKF